MYMAALAAVHQVLALLTGLDEVPSYKILFLGRKTLTRDQFLDHVLDVPDLKAVLDWVVSVLFP